MEICGKEEFVQCPYNKSHVIERRRFQFHLTRCKRSNPTMKAATCDFNSTHLVLEAELQYHHQNCPDRKEYDVSSYRDLDNYIDKYPVKTVKVEADDNWDNLDFQTYNPQVHCQNKDILRKVNVETNLKKKVFYTQERERHANFQKESKNSNKETECTEEAEVTISKAARFLALLKIRSKTYSQNNE